MRKDVKAGLALAFSVVVLAGWYHISKEPADESIALNANDGVIVNLSAEGRTDAKSSDATKGPRTSAKRTDAGSGRTHAAGDAGSANHTGGASSARGRSSAKPTRATRHVADSSTARRTDSVPHARSSQPSTASKTRTSTAKRDVDRATMPTRRGRSDDTSQHKPRTRTASIRRPAISTPALKPRTVQPKDKGYESHIVKAGDSLSLISEMYYGDSAQVAMLRSANPQITDDDDLQIGQRVLLPPARAARSDDSTAGRTGPHRTHGSLTRHGDDKSEHTYEVQPGDSLYVVAKKELGSGSRWKEIFDLNRKAIGSDPARLKVGQKLTLPPS